MAVDIYHRRRSYIASQDIRVRGPRNNTVRSLRGVRGLLQARRKRKTVAFKLDKAIIKLYFTVSLSDVERLLLQEYSSYLDSDAASYWQKLCARGPRQERRWPRD
jgi:hypothetical protein